MLTDDWLVEAASCAIPVTLSEKVPLVVERNGGSHALRSLEPSAPEVLHGRPVSD